MKTQPKTPADLTAKIALSIAARFDTDTGLRALFRRWQPDDQARPNLDLALEVYKCGMEKELFPEIPDGANNSESHYALIQSIANRAAVLTSILAQHGKSEDQKLGLGAALYRAGMSESRLNRLFTATEETRIDGFLRAHQLVARKGLKPTLDLKECRRYYNFLYFGDRRAIEKWVAEYFQAEFSGKKSESSII